MQGILTLFVLLPVVVSAAETNDALVKDFAPTSGYIVQQSGDEFIIDLDAKQKISVGDIFSVVTPGEKIIHPVTKQVLGSKDALKGMLQVTRIKAGYSYCRPMGPASSLKTGDAVHRYQNIDAEFWDYTGQGEAYFVELQRMLPHIQWMSYATSQKHRPATTASILPQGKTSALYFILTDQGMDVRSPDFELIHRYPVPDPIRSVTAIPSPAPTVVSSTQQAIETASKDTVMINQTPERGIGNYWTSPIMQGTPVGVEAGDLDGDGQQEIAIAFGERIEIHRLVKGSHKVLSTIPFGGTLRAYHLDGMDLKKTGRMQLFVSAVTPGGNLSGFIIENSNGEYRITQKKIPWHMRRITMPGETPVLIAQKMGAQGREFAEPVFSVTWDGADIVAGSLFDIPRNANLYSFLPLPGKERKLFAYLGDDGFLSIVTPDGQIVASSIDKMGGSESYLEVNEDVQTGGESRHSYLSVRIEVNARGEIIIPVNTGHSMLSRLKMYSKSELIAMVWDGTKLLDRWYSAPGKSYLADFRLADVNNDGQTSLVTVVAYPESNPFLPRKTALHVYRLN
jgi:hypothetical protein